MITSVDKDMDKLEAPNIAGWIENGAATLENSLTVPQKDRHRISI